MPKFDVITIGGAVRDVTFYTNKGQIFKTPQNLTTQKMFAFEHGAKINIDQSYLTLGGGAANTGTTFARLGFRVASLIRVGEDYDGEHIKNELKKQGVNTNLIQTDKIIRTGFSFILTNNKKDKDHVAFLYRGANENLETIPKIVKSLSADYFFITSLSGKNWTKTLGNVISQAVRNKTKIVWNPGNLQLQAGKRGLERFLKYVDILILNKDEAIELVLSGIRIGRRDPKFLNNSVYLLNILNEWGPKIVVVTEGEKGAAAYKDGKIFRIKALKKKTIDTTGVGDAFASAFVSGLIESKNNIKQGLIWGILNSGNVVTEVGAQNGILTKKEITEKAKNVKQ